MPGNLGGWQPRRVHGGRDERGTVTFDLSRGVERHILDHPHHKFVMCADVSYASPQGSGKVRAEPKVIVDTRPQ